MPKELVSGKPMTHRHLVEEKAAVGGWIEAVDVPSFGPITTCVNENGIAERLKRNLGATFSWWSHTSRAGELTALLGDVALVGLPDQNSDTTDVPENILELLTETTPDVVSMKIGDEWLANRVVNRDY